MPASHIQNIIWDMDGVLYPYNTPCLDAIITAISKAVPTLNPSIDQKQAHEIATLSRATHRNAFTTLVQDHGFEINELVTASFDRIDIDAMITPDQKQADIIRSFGANQVILTLADTDWALRVVKHLGLYDVFNEANIITCSKTPDMAKSASTKPFLYALDHMGFDPACTIMVEDTVRNLKHAKDVGLTTALVYGEAENKPEYVDHLFETTPHFLKTLKPSAF